MSRDALHMQFLGLLAVALVAASVSGCTWVTRTGELRTESQIVELDGAEYAQVDLKMGAGGLTLSGGADALAQADFTYNVPDWEPIIDYAVVSGEHGELRIEQPELGNLGLESYRYEWDVRLNNEVPMELDVALGAGESELDVSTLNLTRLDLNAGVGVVEIDLRGDRQQDLDVTIRGGVGEATLLLPDDVGVEATVSGGLGELDVTGLTRSGDVYVNDAYGESEATINLDVEGGIGGVTLDVVGS